MASYDVEYASKICRALDEDRGGHAVGRLLAQRRARRPDRHHGVGAATAGHAIHRHRRAQPRGRRGAAGAERGVPAGAGQAGQVQGGGQGLAVCS